MKKKVIAILGYFGHTNIGDEAILHCLIEQLGQMPLRHQIAVFSDNPPYTLRTHGVTSVNDILPTTLPQLLVGALGRNRRNFFNSLNTFWRSEILIVGGGGLFFDSPETNKYLLKLLKKIDWAKKLDKKVMILGVGIGPLYHTESKSILSDVLNRVDLVTVRDRYSWEWLGQLGVSNPRIHLTSDFAFLLQAEFKEKIEEILRSEKLEVTETPTIGVCLCGRHAKIPSLKKSIVKFCEYVTTQLGGQVWFIPMQTGGGDDDRPGLNSIMHELLENKNIFLLNGEYNPKEILGIMNYTNAIIGERLHSIIFSLINNIPFLGIAYMPKVESLFDEMGHTEWYVRLDEIDEINLITRFTQIWKSIEQIKEQLTEYKSLYRERALNNFSLLADLLAKERKQEN